MDSLAKPSAGANNPSTPDVRLDVVQSTQNLVERAEAMKSRLLALTFCGLIFSAGAFAEDKAKDVNQDAVVSELDVKWLDVKWLPVQPKTGLEDYLQLLIKAESLPNLFPNEKVQTRLKKQVNFPKQQLLLFAWPSEPDDKLTYTVEKGEKGPVVMFRFEGGKKKKRQDPDAKRVPPEEAYKPKKKSERQIRAFAIANQVPCYTQGWPQAPDPFTIPKDATRKEP